MSRKVMRIVIGTIFLALGIAGLFLPVLQGVLFLALGALILSIDVPLFSRMVCWLEKWFPSITKYTNRLRSWPGSRGVAPQETTEGSDQTSQRR